jgi:hypothetical protein
MIPPIKVKGLLKKKTEAQLTLQVQKAGPPFEHLQGKPLDVPMNEVWGLNPLDPVEDQEVRVSVDPFWMGSNHRGV